MRTNAHIGMLLGSHVRRDTTYRHTRLFRPPVECSLEGYYPHHLREPDTQTLKSYGADLIVVYLSLRRLLFDCSTAVESDHSDRVVPDVRSTGPPI